MLISAAQVLNDSVSKALVHALCDTVDETALFASMFNKLFDCLNVSSLSAGGLKRNAFNKPYLSAFDFQLKVCACVCVCVCVCVCRPVGWSVTGGVRFYTKWTYCLSTIQAVDVEHTTYACMPYRIAGKFTLSFSQENFPLYGNYACK